MNTPPPGTAATGAYERIAPYYDLLDLPFEYGRYRSLRRRLWAGLSGRLLDAGAGTGRNIPFYPPGAEVVGLDSSPAMLRRAERRRRRLGAAVELRCADIRSTGFPDDHFDGVVATFLFCVLPDERQPAALREIARVCKPGATVRLLDYTLSHHPLRRAVMRLWAPWVAWAYGAGFERRTEEHVRRSPLTIVRSEFVHADIIMLIEARAPG